jgi:hypothetical protein
MRKIRFFAIGSGVFMLGIGVAVAGIYARNPLIPPALYPAQGAPFTVTIESVWEGTPGHPPGREFTKVIRDTGGRERIESPAMEETVVTGEPARFDIYDFAQERMIELDPQPKIAIVRRMEHVGRPIKIDLSADPAVPGHPAKGGEYLGMQQIAGQETWGQHLAQTFHYADGHTEMSVCDLWLSAVYKMPLMQVREDGQLGKLTQRVIRFEAGEPDANLFEIPADYTVLQGK